MIVYEVNLQVDNGIFEPFVTWLKAHIREMGDFDGFGEGTIETAEEGNPGCTLLVVRYPVRDREALENYFHIGAPKMREDGLQRFPNQFSATRRILKPLQAS